MQSQLEIVPVPALSDNYIWLVHDPDSGETAVVDPGDAAPALAEAERRGWAIGQVWNTHKHWDHTNGNLAVKQATGAIVSGPRRSAGPRLTLGEGGELRLGNHVGRAIEIPGHTLGHIALVFDEARRRLRRRHLVRDGLRPPVRRHGRADARLAAADRGAARRHAALPGPRIYAVERALRRPRRARQRGDRRAPARSRGDARARRSHVADHRRARKKPPTRSSGRPTPTISRSCAATRTISPRRRMMRPLIEESADAYPCPCRRFHRAPGRLRDRPAAAAHRWPPSSICSSCWPARRRAPPETCLPYPHVVGHGDHRRPDRPVPRRRQARLADRDARPLQLARIRAITRWSPATSAAQGPCGGDIAQLVDLSSGMTVGSCVWGDFVPYTEAAG